MWCLCYIAAWGMTTLLASLFTRAAIRLAPRLGLVDIPLHEAHKSHRKSTPVMGGAAMCTAWFCTILAGLLFCRFLSEKLSPEISVYLPGIQQVISSLSIIAGGALCLTLAGLLDDRTPLKALPKFAIQFAVAALTAAFGLRISFLHTIPGANFIITVLWIVTVINALNFFDNMDGLAAGAALQAALVFMFVAVFRGQHFIALLSAVTGGAALGFLFHNAPPARIFMGDSGSHFLGYLLAIIGILTSFYVPGENPTPMPICIPLMALAVPLLDAVTVILIRLKLHVPIYKGDKRHISHRFANLGLPRPLAVLLVLLLSLIIGILGLTLLWLPPAGVLLILAAVAALFAIVLIIQFKIAS